MFNSQYLGDLGIPKNDSPPTMEFAQEGKPVLVFSAKEIRYNHDEYPNDTAKQAAHRIFPLLRGTLLQSLTTNRPVQMNIRAHDEHPERHITFTTSSIEHNYELSTWNWWFIHHIEELIKKNF